MGFGTRSTPTRGTKSKQSPAGDWEAMLWAPRGHDNRQVPTRCSTPRGWGGGSQGARSQGLPSPVWGEGLGVACPCATGAVPSPDQEVREAGLGGGANQPEPPHLRPLYHEGAALLLPRECPGGEVLGGGPQSGWEGCTECAQRAWYPAFSGGAPNPPLTLGATDGGSCGVPPLAQPSLAPAPSSLLPGLTRSHLAPQPFSKSATEHVQSHLSKKQVPPDLFQVGITRDREGVPATSGIRRVNPYGGVGG